MMEWKKGLGCERGEIEFGGVFGAKVGCGVGLGGWGCDGSLLLCCS